MRTISKIVSRCPFLVPLLALLSFASRADVITDWNLKAGEIVSAHQPGPPGSATLAVLQTAVFDAVNAITRQYPKASIPTLQPAPGASVDAAVAAVNRSVLLKLAPSQQAATQALPGLTRSWNSVADFVQEVSDARIYDGVRYRNSTEVGSAPGRKVGELAVAKLMN